MSRYILCFGVLLFMISSCDEEELGCDGVPGSGLEFDGCGICGGDNSICRDFNYPISIGNMWVYEGTFTRELYDSTNYSYNQTENILDSIVVDDLYNELDNIYKIKTISETPNSVGYQYISSVLGVGLFHHGYENPNTIVLPRLLYSKPEYRINGIYYTNSELMEFINYGSSEIIWENSPLLSIKYPIKIDHQWVYRSKGNPWRMDKKVIEKSNSQFKIQNLYDIDSTLSWDQNIKVFLTYSFEIGLIEFDYIIDSLLLFNEVGDSIGYCRNTMNVKLIDHIIN